MKKLAGIFPGGSSDCLSVLAGTIDAVVDQRVCCDGNHCRLALKTANGLRRHIGTIRLEQNTVERGRRKCLAHVVVALKGGRAAIGDILYIPALHRFTVGKKYVFLTQKSVKRLA